MSGRHDVPSLRAGSRPSYAPRRRGCSGRCRAGAAARRRTRSRCAWRRARSRRRRARASASSARNLRLRVRGQWAERRALVEQRRRPRPPRTCCTRTRRRSGSTPASFAARASASVPSRLIAYVQSAFEVAERVVRERGEVHDRVEALEVRRRDVADVERERRRELVRSSPKSQPGSRTVSSPTTRGRPRAGSGASTEPMYP